jgi:hypothetical protein
MDLASLKVNVKRSFITTGAGPLIRRHSINFRKTGNFDCTCVKTSKLAVVSLFGVGNGLVDTVGGGFMV